MAGTPVDCVRLALHHLAPGSVGSSPESIRAAIWAPTFIIPGPWLPLREAAIRGLPGIAVSHYIARGRVIDWARAARWTHDILEMLMARASGGGTFWNVNLPHLGPDDPDPAVVFCPVDPSPLPLSYRLVDGQAVYAGDYQSRIRRAGYDIDVCFSGQISITQLDVSGRDLP